MVPSQQMHICPEPSKMLDNYGKTGISMFFSDIISRLMQALGIRIDRNKKRLPASFASGEAGK